MVYQVSCNLHQSLSHNKSGAVICDNTVCCIIGIPTLNDKDVEVIINVIYLYLSGYFNIIISLLNIDAMAARHQREA